MDVSPYPRFLNADIASGEIIGISAKATLCGITRWLGYKSNGEVWCYLDDKTASETGEIAREIVMFDDATEIVSQMFSSEIRSAFKFV